MLKIVHDDQITLLKIKSLLNHLSYLIKPDHMEAYNDYHDLCRRKCNFSLEEAEELVRKDEQFTGFSSKDNK